MITRRRYMKMPCVRAGAKILLTILCVVATSVLPAYGLESFLSFRTVGDNGSGLRYDITHEQFMCYVRERLILLLDDADEIRRLKEMPIYCAVDASSQLVFESGAIVIGDTLYELLTKDILSDGWQRRRKEKFLHENFHQYSHYDHMEAIFLQYLRGHDINADVMIGDDNLCRAWFEVLAVLDTIESTVTDSDGVVELLRYEAMMKRRFFLPTDFYQYEFAAECNDMVPELYARAREKKVFKARKYGDDFQCVVEDAVGDDYVCFLSWRHATLYYGHRYPVKRLVASDHCFVGECWGDWESDGGKMLIQDMPKKYRAQRHVLLEGAIKRDLKEFILFMKKHYALNGSQELVLADGVRNALPDSFRAAGVRTLDDFLLWCDGAYIVHVTDENASVFGRGARGMLGNKGKNLFVLHDVLSGLDASVPPAYIVTRNVFNALRDGQRTLPDILPLAVLRDAVGIIEQEGAETFGGFDARRVPLLLSVRSSPSVSMPGRLETVLNVGMNDAVAKRLSEIYDPLFVYGLYAKFIRDFSVLVRGCARERFVQALSLYGGDLKNIQTIEALRELVDEYKRIAGSAVSQDVYEQLMLTTQYVFDSWNTGKSEQYRSMVELGDDEGMAVVVQKMVFGSMPGTSGSGVAYTHDLDTLAERTTGFFAAGLQGDQIMGGKTYVNVVPVAHLGMPVTNIFDSISQSLRSAYHVPMEYEFTIEAGKIFILQTRAVKLSGHGALGNSVAGALDNGYTLEPHHIEQVLGTGLSIVPAIIKGVLVHGIQNFNDFIGRFPSYDVILYVDDPDEPEVFETIVSENRIAGVVMTYSSPISHESDILRGREIPVITNFKLSAGIDMEDYNEIPVVLDTKNAMLLLVNNYESVPVTVSRVSHGSIPLQPIRDSVQACIDAMADMCVMSDQYQMMVVYRALIELAIKEVSPTNGILSAASLTKNTILQVKAHYLSIELERHGSMLRYSLDRVQHDIERCFERLTNISQGDVIMNCDSFERSVCDQVMLRRMLLRSFLCGRAGQENICVVGVPSLSGGFLHDIEKLRGDGSVTIIYVQDITHENAWNLMSVQYQPGFALAASFGGEVLDYVGSFADIITQVKSRLARSRDVVCADLTAGVVSTEDDTGVLNDTNNIFAALKEGVAFDVFREEYQTERLRGDVQENQTACIMAA